MAGEIEEPFRLSLQVDSVHSGSVSFGRFESEALCWERRSSFSHNRYLEEVERCSKPGSVTEKKALLEAHFRKKGFLGLNSPGCLNDAESWSNKSDVPREMINDGEIGQMNDANRCTRFEETEVYGTPFPEPQSELSAVATNNADHFSGHGTGIQADGGERHSLISANSLFLVEKKDSLDSEKSNLDENHVSDIVIDKFHGNHTNLEYSTDPSPKAHLQGSSTKERTPTKTECKKPRATPRNRVEENRRYTSSNASQLSEKKVSKTVAVRSTMAITSETRNRHLMHETSKYKPGAATRRVDKLNSAEKDSTNRSITGPKLRQSTNRVSPAVGADNSRLRENNNRFSFKNNEHAQRRQEFDLKLVAKMQTKEAKIHEVRAIAQERKTGEIKQLGKSLHFKATPNRGAFREPHGPKTTTSNIRLHKLPSKASNPRIGVAKNQQSSNKGAAEQTVSRCGSMRTTDLPQASATSCHSTVTSDSCTSSPAGASNRYPSPAGKRLISKKKELEKERPTSSRKNKVPEGNQMHKVKTTDAKQKIRTTRAGQVATNATS